MIQSPVITQVSAAPGNYFPGRGGTPIDTIVLHTEQGTEKGTEEWFSDPRAHVSAHFSIGKDGAVVQEVRLDDTAFHAGNSLYNKRSIGVELEGFEEQGDFPAPMMDSLVQLCGWLSSCFGIPLDRDHLIGHCEVPDPHDPTGTLRGGASHHTDPGARFPWNDLIAALQPTPVA